MDPTKVEKSKKEAMKEYKRKYYLANRERLLEQRKEYIKEHYQANREYMSKYYLANKERILAQQKEYMPKYYQANKERILAQQKEYRRERKKKISEAKADH